MRKGLTKEELLIIKNSDTTKNCKSCNIDKLLIKFPYKKENNNFYYISHECNSCLYQKRIMSNKLDFEKYKEVQKNKEYFTIEGRASLLRNRCKQRSKIYKKEFSLSKEYIIQLLHLKKCQKTNIDLIMDDSKYNPYAPSIDRIDNSKGYTDDNIQIVCMIYNFCKNNFKEKDVDDFFKKINNDG